MHNNHSLTRQRLRRVVADKLRPAVRPESIPMTIHAWRAPGEPPTIEQALSAGYVELEQGAMWGIPWGTTWFRFVADVPERWRGRSIEATLNLGFTNLTGFQAEGLVWVKPEQEWIPWKGLHPHNHRLVVAEGEDCPEKIELFVEAASNPTLVSHRPDSNSDVLTAARTPIYSLGRIALNTFEPDVDALLLDYDVIASLLDQLGPESPRGANLSVALERSLDRLDFDDIAGTVELARGELADVLSQPAAPSAHRVSAVGHAHIDTAWLWPIRETKRKCSRTFSNVLRLMDEYPELVFACSQAVQYQWMKDDYPSIFEAISKRVAEGRWLTTGGMWVESDTNLPSGESLVRQFLCGQSFFAEHFGHRDTEVWIPDVFGYPASLPQIMRLSGFRNFLTQKLSWNKTNRFPHNTFNWEGLDGSVIFTHFPSVETYNATFSGAELAHTVDAFKEHGNANRSLMPFGFGDGGGGPTRVMMERYRRVRDLDGSPRIDIEAPSEFFDKAAEEYPDPPRWVGELYFEMHRGTFTSQAKTKAANRRCEILLAEAELWSCAAFGARRDDGYPAEKLGELWRDVLTQQFHDILPGSSIGWVHREAEETLDRVATELESLIGTGLESLASPGSVSVANSSPADRREVVILPSSARSAMAPDHLERCQELDDGSVAAFLDLPARSVQPLQPELSPGSVSVGNGFLDNGIVRVGFDQSGLITSIVDQRDDRELVAAGGIANRLALYQDFPTEYDAWDLDEFYRSQGVYLDEADGIVVLDEGPLVAQVRIERSFGSSRVVQVVRLRAGSARVDIDTTVEWNEREKVLKAEFELDLHSHEVAREIQFGHVRTPIHTNTTWDVARFEVCAHRWIDVGESGYGVALLNDSKYGHDVRRTRSATGETSTTMGLTLLRAPNYPDPTADAGTHRFTYSLLPHGGDIADGDVVAEGYRLNGSVRVITGRRSTPVPGEPGALRVVSSDNAGVVIETVKAAEDDSGDVIVRGYEAHGGQARGHIDFGFLIGDVVANDTLEGTDNLAPVGVIRSGNGVDLALRPFQVFTLRATPA